MVQEVEISIIIPFFNRVDLLFSTLESIKDQSFSDFEVLLIDDGSYSSEVEKLQIYLKKGLDDRFQYINKPKALLKGANSSRYYGFQISRGKYLKWFDSDDIMHPDFLEIQYNVFEKGNFDGVIANCGVYSKDLSVKMKDSWRKLVFSNTPLQDYLRTRLAWQTGAGLWRKDALHEVAPFSETLTNGQEWIFHLKVLTSDLKIGIIEKELFKVRAHNDSISKNKKPYYLENRFKARVIALNRLFKTRNPGKRYLVKSLGKMWFDKKANKLRLLRIIVKHLSIRQENKRLASLEKLSHF